MDTKEKIEWANQILGSQPTVKYLKKDNSILEIKDSSRIILTEDNRELLID